MPHPRPYWFNHTKKDVYLQFWPARGGLEFFLPRDYDKLNT
jgi:hypothetical protein